MWGFVGRGRQRHLLNEVDSVWKNLILFSSQSYTHPYTRSTEGFAVRRVAEQHYSSAPTHIQWVVRAYFLIAVPSRQSYCVNLGESTRKVLRGRRILVVECAGSAYLVRPPTKGGRGVDEWLWKCWITTVQWIAMKHEPRETDKFSPTFLWINFITWRSRKWFVKLLSLNLTTIRVVSSARFCLCFPFHLARNQPLGPVVVISCRGRRVDICPFRI